MGNYLGIDIGTSGCKALVFDRTGRQLASSRREYDVTTSADGAAELDSELVIARCFEAIAAAAQECGSGTVTALGVSSQGEAFTAVGPDREILSRAMVSSDTRAAAVARTWTRRLGARRLYARTGHTAHPMFTLFKLLWFRDAHPDVWRRARYFLCFEDLLGFRLGLPEPRISWNLASRTLLFDIRKHRWDPMLVAAAGLRQSQLANPIPSGAICGVVAAEVAAALHLAPGATIIAGGHDQSVGALGAGVTAPGTAMYASGTVECLAPAFAKRAQSEHLRRHNLCTYDHVVPGLYTTVAFSLTGGNLLRWFRDEFGAAEMALAGGDSGKAYELLLRHASATPTSLLVLPYFTPSGTPYFDIETRGAILGLRLSTRRGEILRALLEGIAFEMRLNLEILAAAGCQVNELRVVGGGARSPYWNQLRADVLGQPVAVMDVHEAGCLGAALLACAADTGRSVGTLAREWVRCTSTCLPNPERARWYSRRFAAYRRLRPALRRLHL